jgi:ACS family hexuronate transporter-like MFS transporter
MVLPADLFPQSVVGSVAGLVGFGGALGGIAFGELVGYLLDKGLGYSTVFAFAGMLHIAAFGIILASIRTVKPLSLNQKIGCEVAQ